MNKSEKEQVKFETVEDMVVYIERFHYMPDYRWKLSFNSHSEWVDEAAGKAWRKEYEAIKYPTNGSDNREYKAYDRKREQVKKRCPAKKQIFKYYLYSKGSWRGNYIHLSKELYDLLDSIWTKGPMYRFSDTLENKGRITIPGMLKRLGKTDVGEKIKAAKQAEKEASEKHSRNYQRKQIREKAAELHKLIADNNALLEDFITEIMPEDLIPALAMLGICLKDEE